MTTPGSNTLRLAQSVQGLQPINYFATSGRSANAIGVWNATYSAPVLIYGSCQPVPRTLYEQLGLDLNKSYVNLYLTRAMQDIARGTAGDQFAYGGRKYQLLSNVNWQAADGWTGTIAADLGDDNNTYLALGLYTNPGSSTYSIASASFANGAMVIIDIPRWTIGNGYIRPVIFGNALANGAQVAVNVSIGGVNQGSRTVVAATGIATDSSGSPYPGLNSYGVVAGGFRLQCNVRLAISSPDVSTCGITLSGGVTP